MVLGKLPVPGGSTVWMIVGQGLTALAVGVPYFFGYKTGFFPSKTIQKFSIRLVRRI